MGEPIIQSIADKRKKAILLGLIISAFAVSALMLVWTNVQYNSEDNWYSGGTSYITVSGIKVPVNHKSSYRYYTDFVSYYLSIISAVIGVGSLAFLLATMKSALTVAESYIHGTKLLGKSIDIPVDMISSVSSSKLLSGVVISTGSGKQRFYWMSNYAQICQAIQNLLVERQSKASVPVQATSTQEIPQSNADELKKFKELLDSGVISQDEFDAKKKQLLGL